MRTLMKVSMNVDAGNKAIQDGSLPRLMQSTMEELKPEAAYFYAERGCRTAMFVFDLKDTAQIPVIAEPFFMKLQARVEFHPVMDARDMQAGVAAATKKRG